MAPNRPRAKSRLAQLEREIKSQANKPQAAILQQFFKTGPGQYGAGDLFLGLKVPLQRQIAHKYTDLPLKDVQRLLNSKIHEFRLIALMILLAQYEAATNLAAKQTIVEFYLQNTARINNWDLVDSSVYKILGNFLLLAAKSPNVPAKYKAPAFLTKLAKSSNLWERRMAMVATYAFICAGRTAETFLIAEQLLKDEHDLIHKAVGWMLREAGKRVSTAELKNFLDQHRRQLPRTALRYAIERLNPRAREHYLAAGRD
jgi:3-methyladenine DNA glycosylase AlkD